MATITIPGMFLTGDHASRPAANAVGTGSLYACSDHALIYQSDGSSWSTWADLSGTSAGAPSDAEYLVTTADGDLSAERVVDLGAYSLLTRRAAANSEDDHFDASSLDGKWGAYTGQNATVVTTDLLGWAHLTASGYKLQAVPSGDWTIETEVIAPGYLAAQFQNFGLVIASNNNTSSSTDMLLGIGNGNSLSTTDPNRIVWEKRVNGSFDSAYTTSRTSLVDDHLFLKLVKSGSNYQAFYSSNGRNWEALAAAAAAGFTAAYFGFGGTSSGATIGAYFNYFLRY